MALIALGLGFGILALKLWIQLATRIPSAAVGVIVALVCFSPHVFALLYAHGVPASIDRPLIVIKDVLLYSLLATLLWTQRHRQEVRMAALLTSALGILLLLWALRSPPTVPIQIVLLGARDLAVPAVALTIAIALPTDARPRVLRTSLAIIAVAAAYAIFEYVLPVSYLVDVIHVGDYWANVKQQPGYLWNFPGVGFLPGNTFTSLSPDGTRRLAGSFGDPLAAGYILGVGVIVGLGLRKTRATLLATLIIGVALALTFTRAGWLIGLFGAIGYLIAARSRPVLASFVGVVAIAVLGVAVIPSYREYILSVVSGRNGSTLGHLQAVSSALTAHYSLFGGGIGTAGSVAASNPSLVAAAHGTESVISSVVLQLGIVAALAYFLIIAWMIRLALKHETTVARQRAIWVGASLGLLVSLLVSEQLTSFNSGIVPILLTTIGVFYGMELPQGPASYEVRRIADDTPLTR